MPRKQARYGQPAVYNNTLPTYADGDDAGLQVDSSGRLIISNLATDGSATPNAGMTISGEYNLVQPTLADGNVTTLQVDSNGNLRVVNTGASGYTEGATTSPAIGTLSEGRYKATAPTLTDGQLYGLQLDVNGNQKQNLATKLDSVNDSITSYDFGHSFTPISTSTTTTAKTGAGVLKRIIVTSPGATSNTIKIYDNTAASGTVIADWSTAGGVPTVGVFDFDVAFTTGLTIVTAGTTPPILTAVWR